MSKGISYLFKNTKGLKKYKKGQEEPDYYVGSNGGVLLAKYKKWLGVSRRKSLLRIAKNAKLKNAVDQLYRPGAIIGDGGTASVLKFEKATGLGLGKNGNTHATKALCTIKYIKRIMQTQNLSHGDQKLARKLLKDLINALGGPEK